MYPIIRARPVNAISPAPIATAPIPVTTIEPITVASAAKPVIANPATATPLSADSHGTLLIAIIAGAIEYWITAAIAVIASKPAIAATAPTPVIITAPIASANNATPVIANPAAITLPRAAFHGTLLIAIIAGVIEYWINAAITAIVVNPAIAATAPTPVPIAAPIVSANNAIVVIANPAATIPPIASPHLTWPSFIIAGAIAKFKIAAIAPKAINPFNILLQGTIIKPANTLRNARIPPATNKIVFVSTDGIPPIDLIIKYIAVPSAAIPATAPIPLNNVENQLLFDSALSCLRSFNDFFDISINLTSTTLEVALLLLSWPVKSESKLNPSVELKIFAILFHLVRSFEDKLGGTSGPKPSLILFLLLSSAYREVVFSFCSLNFKQNCSNKSKTLDNCAVTSIINIY